MRQGITHCRVATGGLREVTSVPPRHGCQLLLHTAMPIAKPYLQVLDNFSQATEAKMAGFNNTGMDGPYRNLIDAFTLDGEEFIAVSFLVTLGIGVGPDRVAIAHQTGIT